MFIDFTTFIGQTITKESGKPFKSGEKVGTVVGTTINPNTFLPAFMMDDGSVVDCHQCLNEAGDRIVSQKLHRSMSSSVKKKMRELKASKALG